MCYLSSLPQTKVIDTPIITNKYLFDMFVWKTSWWLAMLKRKNLATPRISYGPHKLHHIFISICDLNWLLNYICWHSNANSNFIYSRLQTSDIVPWKFQVHRNAKNLILQYIDYNWNLFSTIFVLIKPTRKKKLCYH